MGWGSNNELMIFPIIDIIRKEVKNMIRNGTITLDEILETPQGNNLYVATDNSSKQVNITGNLLTRLESNDFELTLEKNDPSKPNMLTGVVITFGDDLKQVINLLRQDNKLAYVKTSVILLEKSTEKIQNPYSMSGGDFVEYVRNKKVWMYYKNISEDESKSQQERDNARTKMEYLNVRNQELRNLYGIPDSADMPYEDLVKYIPNPLGMEMYDFIEYVKNIRCYMSPNATQEQKDKAHEDNVALRIKYVIPEEDSGAFPYEELVQYLPNPLGMHHDDFVAYVKNRQEYLELDPSNPEHADDILRIEIENKNLLEKYFTEDTYLLGELEEYLERNTAVYEERVLLQIVISLTYNKDGKLERVKSEVLEGD